MRQDVNYSHSKNIGEQIGSFCGVPILTFNNFDLELDVALDSQRTVLSNKAMGCSDIPNTAEILPGEVLCSDNIVRRITTAEAVGYDAFKEKQPVKMLVGGDKGDYYDSEFNCWRSRNEWKRLGNGDLVRIMSGQSTPEELCVWLNVTFNETVPSYAQRSFKSRVEVDGADKLLITDDNNGLQVHAFRYVDGTPSTYIGGDEVRPFDPPQFSMGNNSPTRVVQYFDIEEEGRLKRIEKEATKETELESTLTYSKFDFSRQQELDKQRRDCEACYTSTTHVERMSIGGNALFDVLRESIEIMKASAEPEITLAQPQVCEWYPDGETQCGAAITHAASKYKAGTCNACYAAREARD